MSEPLSPAELAIHVAICEGSPRDCKDWRGRCVKAAEAARPVIAREVALELGRDCLRDGLGPFLERLVGEQNADRLLATDRAALLKATARDWPRSNESVSMKPDVEGWLRRWAEHFEHTATRPLEGEQDHA